MDALTKVLLAEDDPRAASSLAALLARQGYAVVRAQSGQDAIRLTATHAPDILLLNLGLPDMDGLAVLERVRQWSDVPVMVVSARREERDKVQALDGGANDYVTKPFGEAELLARIRAALRTRRQCACQPRDSVFCNGGLRIDYEKRAVTVDRRAVHLTPTEYQIMLLLAQNLGKVLTHDFLLNRLWGDYGGECQTLRVNIANIRKKTEKNSAQPQYIVTESGVGYRMVER